MKVAFVLTQERGGPVDLTVGLALELAGRTGGPDVTIVGPEPVTSAGDARALLRPVTVATKTDLRAAAELRRVLTRVAPDVVHAQDRRAGLVAATVARSRVPLVATYHGVPDEGAGPWLRAGPLARRRPTPRATAVLVADAAVARLVTVTVSPSAAMARFLRERLRVPPHRVRVIPSGVALPPAKPPDGPARRFVSVGTFSTSKAVPVLIDAFACVAAGRADVRLRLVGDGEERASCERMVERAGLADRVEFTGYRRDVPVQLAGSDAFVLSSVNENLPLSLLEAMGAGLACVASDVGAVSEAIEDGCGLLVPPGDAEALAGAMARLVDEPDLAPALGRAAADAARHKFAVSACADAHLRLWNELLSSR